MEQVSDYNTCEITKHYTGESSGNPTTDACAPTSSFSSVYYSPRIQRMIGDHRSGVEVDIENSRVHWSDVASSNSASSGLPNRKCYELLKKRRKWSWLFIKFMEMVLGQGIKEGDMANRERFEMLKKHPEWGGFFKDIKVVLGKKINEGGQGEIFDAKVEFEDSTEFDYGSHVVKVMKLGDSPLQDFERQWPVEMLCNVSKDRDKGPLMWIKGGTLIHNRFAFVMVKQWGDLRKLIDLKKVKKDEVIGEVGFINRAVFRIGKGLVFNDLTNNQGPPFEKKFKFICKVMLCIAEDMERLHTEYKIVHRDLKASNVLLWSLGKELQPDSNPDVKAHVVDYECCVGVGGTKFWRAPEILQQVKDGVPLLELVFTKMSDVYSYGMTCYEILTGRIPFEERPFTDYDFVLQGNRPELPTLPESLDYIIVMILSCWDQDPLRRPTFLEIVEILRQGPSRVPPWWPAPEQAPTLPSETTAQAQREANTLLNDMLNKMSDRNYDYEPANLLKIRELCRNYGARVGFTSEGHRDHFFEAAITYVQNVCDWHAEFPDEGVHKFIGGLAGNIGLDAQVAALLVSNSVGNRTLYTFKRTMALNAQGRIEAAYKELEGLIRIHESLSPVPNSRALEWAATVLRDLPVADRSRLLEMYILAGGSDTEWFAREALSLW